MPLSLVISAQHPGTHFIPFIPFPIFGRVYRRSERHPWHQTYVVALPEQAKQQGPPNDRLFNPRSTNGARWAVLEVWCVCAMQFDTA